MKPQLRYFLEDIRHLTLFPRRYDAPQGKSLDYWKKVAKDYANQRKKVEDCLWKWYIIEYRDGHKELAYLRVLQKGLFSGLGSAIYRGPIIPHMIDIATYANIKQIYLAF